MAKTPQVSSPPAGTKSSAEVPVTNPKNIEAVYSNQVGISRTMTDFTIFFLELGQSPGPEGAVQRNEVKSVVTLPLAAAGALINVLQQLLGQAQLGQEGKPKDRGIQ